MRSARERGAANVRALVEDLHRVAATEGVSNRHVAGVAQVSPSTIGNWWKHRASPNLVAFSRVGVALGVRLDLEPVDGPPSPRPNSSPPAQDLLGRGLNGPLEYAVLRILGSEIRWLRRTVLRGSAYTVSRDHQELSSHSWVLAEHGFSGRSRVESTVRAETMATAAALCGHKLVWVPTVGPWKTYPWVE